MYIYPCSRLSILNFIYSLIYRLYMNFLISVKDPISFKTSDFFIGINASHKTVDNHFFELCFGIPYSQLTANKNNKEWLGWGISFDIRFIRSWVGGIKIDLNTSNNLIWDKSYTGTIGSLKYFSFNLKPRCHLIQEG